MPEPVSRNSLRTAYLAVPDIPEDHQSVNDSGFDSTTATLTLLPPALEDYENGRYRGTITGNNRVGLMDGDI
uniref:Uncharacterized protein n=1 Tax=Panagrolaimus sp. ES5 TaxID=591445 RepID=A0AC34F1N8_9BILA